MVALKVAWSAASMGETKAGRTAVMTVVVMVAMMVALTAVMMTVPWVATKAVQRVV